ncbi:son of sevenless homolog 2-like [Gordionus sp. m RMFG-2023]|uniref:son of sevenless homolog 2-like n=1 Tax=Gordionus sp. m RMFG-2023 TaxID=3053472 RepID=UPI0031FBBBD2
MYLENIIEYIIREEAIYLKDLKYIDRLIKYPLRTYYSNKPNENKFCAKTNWLVNLDILDDIYYLSVKLIWGLEDCKQLLEIQLNSNEMVNLFEDLVLVQEFNVYLKYITGVLQYICSNHDVFKICDSDCDNMNCLTNNFDSDFSKYLQLIHPQIKDIYLYVLPRLLYIPILHFFFYHHIIQELIKFYGSRKLFYPSPSTSINEELIKLENALTALDLLKADILCQCPPWLQGQLNRCSRPGKEDSDNNKTDCIEGWPDKPHIRALVNLNTGIVASNNEFSSNSTSGANKLSKPLSAELLLMEGPLLKVTSPDTNTNLEERYCFLWENGTFIACKSPTFFNSSTMRRTSLETLLSTLLVEPHVHTASPFHSLGIAKNSESKEGKEFRDNGEVLTDCYKPDFKISEGFAIKNCSVYPVEDDPCTFRIVPNNNDNFITSFCSEKSSETYDWLSFLIKISTQNSLNKQISSMIEADESTQPYSILVHLKDKYRYCQQDTPQNIVFDCKYDKEIPLVKAGTLDKLIERLTFPKYSDPFYLSIFLVVYRTFVHPTQLFDALMDRYNIPEIDDHTLENIKKSFRDRHNSAKSLNQPSLTEENLEIACKEALLKFRKEFVVLVQFRVINVLRQWLNYHYYDFKRDPTLTSKLRTFLDHLRVKKSKRRCVQMMNNLIDKRLENKDKNIEFIFNVQPPQIEWYIAKSKDQFNILTLHPVELARQLTLYEFELYKAIKPSELIGTAWIKRDKHYTSPNLLKMTQHSTKITYWLERSILYTENLEERTAVLLRIIEIMLVLNDLNNFNGLLEFISALNSAPVYRLNQTFQQLPPKLIKFYQDMCELMLDKHFKLYREKLKSIDPPCVPFLGIYMSDILHLEEGNPNFITAPDKNTNEGKGVKDTLIINAPSFINVNGETSADNIVDTDKTNAVQVQDKNMEKILKNDKLDSSGNREDSSSQGNDNCKLINFYKWTKVAQVCNDIQDYQNTPYHFTVEMDIRAYIQEIDPYNGIPEMEFDDVLYQKSLEIEPKDAKQLPKFPRKFENLPTLKSPGIKTLKPQHQQQNQAVLKSSNLPSHRHNSLSPSSPRAHSASLDVSRDSLMDTKAPNNFKKLFFKRRSSGGGLSKKSIMNHYNNGDLANRNGHGANKYNPNKIRDEAYETFDSPVSPTGSTVPLLANALHNSLSPFSPHFPLPSTDSGAITSIPSHIITSAQYSPPLSPLSNSDTLYHPFFTFPRHSTIVTDNNYPPINSSQNLQISEYDVQHDTGIVDNQYDLIVMSPPPILPRLPSVPPPLPPKTERMAQPFTNKYAQATQQNFVLPPPRIPPRKNSSIKSKSRRKVKEKSPPLPPI